MENSDKPIGIFDSGVGGLSVLKEILQKLPQENTIYFADTVRRRYSNKPEEVIKEYSFEIIDFLIFQKVKLIVIACNTATSVALYEAQQRFNVPVIGVIEPGVKMALKNTKSKKIGIIAGEITIRKRIHRKLIKSIDPLIEIFEQATPPFGEFVEQGLINREKIQEIINRYLLPLKEKGIDTLILGCTHYPFLKDFIRKSMGPKVSLINPAKETVSQIKKILIIRGLLNLRNWQPSHSFFTSGDINKFKIVGEKLLEQKINKVEYKNFS